MKHRNLTGDLAIDAACVEFEKALRGNESPSIEEVVGANPDIDHHRLIEQLVLLEVEFLAESEQLPTIEHYEERFPQHRAAIAAILEGCKSGTAMRTAAHEPAEQAGESIGHYRLLEQIGEGGMGVVFMAEQTKPVRRKVALKIIKPGMDTKQVIARFEAERQALAMMDHPNIARVLDAGSTESGRPYFVMELVRGIPFTDYSDQNKLPTSERLELFINVCQAVQHAHTKGIIHRDIKPSNVLVTHHDGVPIPKIIDFGVAKATNQQLTERTLFTAFAQMIGTPLYMSPEQAEMSGLDVDTRSDIYSLGVLLYELLTGTTPVNKKRMQTAAFDEIRRMIREEDPAKPSTAVSTLGEDANTISMRRGTDANRLRQSLSGELDWIVMKALEKDRTRRFQTASDFADDVNRHLSGLAVQACPPTWHYRFNKFAMRYRPQLIVTGLFFGLLLGSSVVAWSLYGAAQLAAQKADESRTEAEAERERSEYQRQLAERNYWRAETQRSETEAAKEALENRLYNQTIDRAFRSYEAGNHLTSRRILDSCAPDRRGWEWSYLNARMSFDRSITVPGPNVRFLAANPTKDELAIIDKDDQLALVDSTTGERKWTTKLPVVDPFKIGFSTDGQYLAAISNFYIRGGGTAVFESSSGELVWHRNVEADEQVGTVFFSPTESRIAFSYLRGDKVGIVEYVDFKNNNVEWTRSEPGFPLATFSPDGKRLFVSLARSTKSALECWDLSNDGSRLWQMPQEAASFAIHHPKESKLLTGGQSGFEIRDANSGVVLSEHLSTGMMIASFDPSGNYFVADGGFQASMVNCVEWKTRELVQSRRLFLPDSIGRYGNGEARWNRHGRIVFCDGMSNRIEEMRPEPSSLYKTFAPPETTLIRRVGFLQGNRLYALGETESQEKLLLWDYLSGQELRHVPLGEGGIIASHVSADGKLLAVGGRAARIFDIGSGRMLHNWPIESGGIWWLKFSADGSRIAAGGSNKAVTVWDVATGKEIVSRRLSDEVDGLAFVDDKGQRVAVLMRFQRRIEILDVDSGQLSTLVSDPGRSRCRRLVFSASKNLLAAGIEDAVELWDVNEGRFVTKLRGYGRSFGAIVFHPDGERIFTRDLMGHVKLWNLVSGEEITSINLSPALSNFQQKSLAISPDGKMVAAAMDDGRVLLLDSERPSLELENERAIVDGATEYVNQMGLSSKSDDEATNLVLKDNELDREAKRIAIEIIQSRESNE